MTIKGDGSFIKGDGSFDGTFLTFINLQSPFQQLVNQNAIKRDGSFDGIFLRFY